MPPKKDDHLSAGNIRRRREFKEYRNGQVREDIDPRKTHCSEHGAELTADEVEFALAMDEYKLRTGRKFPTCSEALEVLKALGYRKQR